MEQPKSSRGCLRFGVFEADPIARELRKNGVKIKLQDQPFQVLAILLERAGEVIPREELRQKVWTADTFVDFDNGLNTAINKIREVLGDSAENPRFVQTLPRRGYRFIAPVDGFAKPAPPTSRRLRLMFVAVAGFTVLLAIAGLYLFTARRRASPSPALTVTRLTNRGNLAGVAISGDGKYLAYVVAAGDQQSLRILQVGTGNDVQLLSAAKADYHRGMTFSPDSSYIYYTRSQPEGQSALYRIPVLGGMPTKLIEDVDSPPGISRDGKRIAFIRYDSIGRTHVLMVAGPDGSGEYKLVQAKYPDEAFDSGPAWSPDGKVLAIWQSSSLVAIPVSGGPAKVIASEWRHQLGQPAWLADGSGLIVAAASVAHSSHYTQLWEISYPDGKATRILDDPFRYGRVSLTADSRILVAQQVDQPSSIWVAPAQDPDRARPVTPLTGRFIGTSGVTWTPDGHILYTSNATGNFELWMTNPDGSSARALPILERAGKFFPSVCPDGRTVVFNGGRDNRKMVLRADLEGGQSQALAEGFYPRCSPDGRWVLFSSENSLVKVSLKGGKPIELSNHPCGAIDISSDGERIACVYRSPNRSWQLAIIPFSGGRATKLLDLDARAVDWPIGWTPDGQAVAFQAERGGVVNIWVQPVGGGPPRQLTHFIADEVQTFAWSPDGRYLALSRGTDIRDAVMITNFR
jgi:Tol biopolymer transport system component/DNA-binding winged helix-turn-helix (wHTH) protein